MKLSRFVLVITGIIIVGALGQIFVLGAQFFSGNYPDAQLHNIPTSDMKMMGLVLMAFSFIPMLMGLLMIFSPFLGTSGKNLKKNGVLYWAEVVNIEHINVPRSNGEAVCRIECGCYDNEGMYRTFYSGLVTPIPDELNIGTYVAVYAHPKKINKYFVDTSQIKATLD